MMDKDGDENEVMRDYAWSECDRLGADAVRWLLPTWDPLMQEFAAEWLGGIDKAERERSNAAQAEMAVSASRAASAAEDAASAAISQARTAAEALKVAREAATNAKVANAIATIALIATIAQFLYSMWSISHHSPAH